VIAISSAFCLGCGTRFPKMPQYCPNEVVLAGWHVPSRCPGPIIQLFVNDQPPPRLMDVDMEEAAS
jgi:hypothetical protein